MKTLLRLVVVCLAVPGGVMFAQGNAAQEKPAVNQENPLSTWNKFAYARVKGILLKSAEKMPEESYGFKPVDTVRSYGQIVGHVADAQYTFSRWHWERKIQRWTSSTQKPQKRI